MRTTRVIGDVLREGAERHPDLVLVRCGAQHRTFAQMVERADRLAAGLAALGVRKGDRVATMAPNRLEAAELIFACARRGAVQVPVNVFLKGEFLRHQLSDSGASVVVADGAGLGAVREIAGDLPGLNHLVALDGEGSAIPYRDLPQPNEPPAIDLAADDLMAIVYTSGTTGLPKGCMLPHGYHTNAAHTSREMLDYRQGDVLLTALPLFHGWARGMLLAAVVHGMTVVLEPEFSAASVLPRLRETEATVFTAVGAMGMAMLALPAADDDHAHSLRAAFMIPFPPAQQDAFTERFGVPVLTQMYGQTEAGAIAFDRLGETGKPGTMGKPSPDFEVRLVDDDDRQVPTGELGEVVIRPRTPGSIYLGYWNAPDATVEAWRNLWHHTGDYARADDDGYLTFVDRKSDALRRRGENVSSLQIEAAVTEHPKVAECAVHAVPSEMTEDEIKACIVLAEGQTSTPDELFAFFREHLPYFAVPRYVEILDALPKTATVRVQKHVLRKRGITSETWDLEALGLVVAKGERR